MPESPSEQIQRPAPTCVLSDMDTESQVKDVEERVLCVIEPLECSRRRV